MALRARGKASTPSAAPAQTEAGAERTDIADAAASTRRPRAAAAAAEASAQRLARQEQARDERAREQLKQSLPPAQGDFPVVPFGTIANIAVHSVLMLALPLGLYYSAVHGLLDPVFAPAFGAVRRENRPLLGGVLAVLGVNAVIVSFLIRAFNEPASSSGSGSGSGAGRRKRD